ncbi:hypothetical protein KCP76_25430 [Salmonella enterica subsp. enterica serovar Weltevreden]|nr:hypothetical protein KCP76_25430 [Salmonella enterica subsp. enterica serovar Weltevreden]
MLTVLTIRVLDASNVGDYLKAADVNAMLTILTRRSLLICNHYEYEVYHFRKCSKIPADTFREQLPKAVEMLRNMQIKR